MTQWPPRRQLLEARLQRPHYAAFALLTLTVVALPFVLPVSASTGAALLVLWCVPVALVAMMFGAVAGGLAGLVATALLVLWDALGGQPGGWPGYLARALAFLLIGFGLGWFTGSARASQRRLADVLDNMLDAVNLAAPVLDASGQVVDGRVTYANAVSAAVMHSTPRALVGRRWSELWPQEYAAELHEKLVSALRQRIPLELTDYVVTPTRRGRTPPVVLDLRATPVGDGLLAAWRDVTDRHLAAAAVAAANAQFAAAFESAPVGMVLVDASGGIVRVNDAFADMTGRPDTELVGLALEVLVHPDDVRAHRTAFDEMVSGQARTVRHEARLLTADGSSRWVSVTSAPLSDGTGAYVLEHVEDIDERKGFEQRLQFFADHDPLTGLFNRRRFIEELARQLSLDSRYGGTSSVLLVDLDHFKDINDTLGHQVGDHFIQAIARRLQLRLRDSDVVCRLGGDEFAVLLPGANESRSSEVAASLLDGIRATELDQGGQRVRSTGSAGIAVVRAGAGDLDDVLANADLAMYAAKEGGRDRHVVYDPAGPEFERTRTRFRWVEQIRVALAEDRFTLLAQPILNLRTGQVAGCELLLRMSDGRRLVGPDAFLEVAEQHGLSSAIDRFVIRRAIAIASTATRPRGFRWEINLSADSIVDPGLPALIEAELARTGLPAEALVFEITENAAIANVEAAQRLAAQLTRIGCRLALDDFGAGNGSFYYLKHLPFTYLKIDGEFIHRLATSDVDRVIVEAIVGAARKLGKQTIAEYVGDARTLDQLRALHVDHAQGYFIGRPVDPSAPLQPA